MTFLTRKKQVSFFLLIVLISQLCFEQTTPAPSQETHKITVSPAKIISPEIAIKPAGSFQDSISRFQYQLILIGISSIASYIDTAIEIKQQKFISARVYNSKTFLFNRVLRI